MMSSLMRMILIMIITLTDRLDRESLREWMVRVMKKSMKNLMITMRIISLGIIVMGTIYYNTMHCIAMVMKLTDRLDWERLREWMVRF